MGMLSVQPNDRVTFRTRYEDEHLLVVGKPPGVVTLPGLGHESDTLLNGLFAQYGSTLQNLGKARDFGLLHRLDRETSGLVMVALSNRAYDALRLAFEERRVEKFYWAVCRQAPPHPKGVIRKSLEEFQGALGDDPKKRKLCRVSGRGKAALTAYRVIAATNLGALVECRPVTGRLHQVRVHMASLGAAILGDDAYGPAEVRSASTRLALHAHRIAFDHPVTGVRIDVRTPWPPDLRRLLNRLGLPRPDQPSTPGSIDRPHEVDDE